MMKEDLMMTNHISRHVFIGGSDARIIMGIYETALLRLWLEKRGEAEPPDYSDNLRVQLGGMRSPFTGPNIMAGDLTGSRQAAVAPQIGRAGQAGASPTPQLRQSAPAARARSASGLCR
jgi:hypothetical protein